MDDLIQEFLAETTESLNALDQDIVRLEQCPDDKDLIGRIFRLVHTVKGTCGFLGLSRLEKVAHHSENVLGRYRDGTLSVQPESVSLILEAFDTIKSIVESLAAEGQEPSGSDQDLIARLDALYESAPSAAPAPAAPETLKEDEHGFVPVPACDFVPETLSVPPQEQVREKTSSSAPKTPQAAGEEGAKSLRVNVDVLENLMTMVSELVLTRNQLLQIMRQHPDSSFATPLQRLNHVVSDLQEGVMQTRMQPISNAWGKLPRIIRDVSLELGKKIDLHMRGAETELDRQVLDLIKDPLTHMVRNSADHGIEQPSDRIRDGKPETGTITLNAFHEGGHIIIEIADDGKGIDSGKILAKAIEKGVLTAEQGSAMTEQQIQQLIFAPGFSTAEKVTAISGRGVGMDVVRTNIEKIGGTIDMRSALGRGTTFTIKIPLTLAIVSALIVEVDGDRYAVPQLSVRELVRLTNDGDARLEDIHGTPIMRLRERLLPLVCLRKVLQLGPPPADSDNIHGKQVIVAEAGGYQFGLIVDRVFDTEEIVVKPVSPILRRFRSFSGNTILGDGTVILILDLNGIAAGIGDLSGLSQSEEDSAAEDCGSTGRKTPLLVFKAGAGAPRAVPLSLVSRLEEFPAGKIEKAGARSVVQYRGRLMPLVPFDESLSLREGKAQPVLVFSEGERAMGLLVDEIVDIVEEHVEMQLSGEGHGAFLGSAIINGQAMDVIDVGHFLGLARDDWFRVRGARQAASAVRRVLLIDDSHFFRNMLQPMLTASGCEVVSVSSADEALRLRRSGALFDLIVSDIEMPGMDGFAFAEEVRAEDSPWRHVSLIALSSHASPRDRARGVEAGFDDYIAKFDRHALLGAVGRMAGGMQVESEVA